MWSVTASFRQATVTVLCVRASYDLRGLEQNESNKKDEFGMHCKEKTQEIEHTHL